MTIEMEKDEAILMVAMIHTHLNKTEKKLGSFLVASMLLEKLRQEIAREEDLPPFIKKLTCPQPM